MNSWYYVNCSYSDNKCVHRLEILAIALHSLYHNIETMHVSHRRQPQYLSSLFKGVALEATTSSLYPQCTFATCTHTQCTVITTHVTVTYQLGIGLYLHSGRKSLSESAIIFATPQHKVPGFSCLSGSQDSNVGQLIGVDGQNITHRRGDHFNVVLGNTRSPGTVRVYPARMAVTTQGVYTCRLPDEAGDIIEFNFGLYLEHLKGNYVPLSYIIIL